VLSPKTLLGREDAVSREGPEKMVVPPPKTVLNFVLSPKTLLGREDAVSREGPEKMVVPSPKTVLKAALGRWRAVVSSPEVLQIFEFSN